jgi:O-antigen/teichoic acid export membrane protein
LAEDQETLIPIEVPLTPERAGAAQWRGKLNSHLGRLLVPRILGEASWILTGQVAAAVGGIVGVPLLAHYLRPEDYGRLALGGTVATLVQQVTLGPVGNAAQRFYAASAETNALSDYLRAALRVTLIAVAFVTAIGGLTLIALAASPWRGAVALAAWSMIFAILSGVSGVFDGIQSAARQRAIVAWHQGLGVWLRFGAAVVLVRIVANAEMAMAGFSAAIIVILLSQLLFFRKAILSSPAYRPGSDAEAVRRICGQMWVYARPFSTWGIFTWGQLASDRWALEAFTTTRIVGVYQALYQLGYYPISMASTFLNQLVQPILFSRAGAGTDETRMRGAYRVVNKILVAIFALSVAGAAVSGLFSKALFHRFLPPAYGSAAPLLPVITLAAGMFAFGQVASLKHMLSTNPRSLIAPKIATAVLGAGLNFGGAYLFGLQGVATAALCFSTIYCVWVVATVPKPIAAPA